MTETITELKLQKLASLIGCSRHPVIISHQHPDGDAVGSCTAMKAFLKAFYGTDATVILPDEAPSTLSFLSNRMDAVFWNTDRDRVAEAVSGADLVLCLDCSGLVRTGEVRDIVMRNTSPRILIDHHPDPQEGDFDLVFSKTDISSASELLYWLLKGIGGQRQLPPDTLEAILTGLTTDTNNFANSVFPSTLSAASELIGAGVDRDSILRHLYNEYNERRIRLFGFLLNKKMVITRQGVAYIFLSRQIAARFGITDGETEGLVNIPLGIGRVRMSIFLKDSGDLIRVSVRSKSGTSANAFASAYFNGGGHECASGGRLVRSRGMSSDREVIEYVKRSIEDFFKDEK